MKLKRFEQVNEEYELHDSDDDKATPSLEEELKKYKECIKEIEYTLTHIKKEPYDYGEGADAAIDEVIDLISRVKGGYRY